MKILSVDYGTKRIGLAYSVSKFAMRYKIIKSDIDELINIFKKEKFDMMLVGLPLNEDLSDSKMALFIKEIFESKKFESIKIEYVNEVMSSRITRIEKNSLLKNRKYVDDESARMILQGYLDENYE